MSEGTLFRRALSALAWIGVAFLVFPVLLTAVVSLNDGFFIAFPPQALSFRWYENIAAIHRIAEATAYSLSVALAAAAAATALALGAALAIARHPLPGKTAVTAFLLSPVTVPMVAIGIALIQFFIAIDAAFTWWSLVIGHVVLVVAYPVRTLLASLTLSDTTLEDAGRSLGASRWRVFRTITLPQLKPGLVSGFLFAFLISFDNYPISVFLVRGEITTMPIEVFNYISNNFDPTPAAFSTVYILIVSLVIALAEWRYRIVSLSIPRS
jgi:putative spermidine/putrescine transport system permease protein